MSRDFNDLIKEVLKNNKEINKIDDKISKDIGGLEKEIMLIKKDIKQISNKIDSIFDILNTLSIFIEDAENIISDDDEDEKYQSNEGWLPEIAEWENEYDDDDEDN